jgi:hypothetical protein
MLSTNDAFQEYDLPDVDVLADTIVMVINSVTWTYVTTLSGSVAADTHFTVIYNSDGTSKVRFGNGTFGAIPGAFDIDVSYATGGGSISLVPALNSVDSYLGTNSDIEGVSNATAMTGGTDEESLETAKDIAPLLLAARDRFVKVDDGKALVLANFAVSLVGIIRNEYGALSCKVVVVPDGGGAPAGATLTAIEVLLIDKTILESVDVRAFAPTYLTQNVTSSFKVLPGYTFANIKPLYELALDLLFSETGQEIVDKYESDGIAAAVTLINTIFTASFTTSDYTQITTFLENLDPADFDKDRQESDVLGFVDAFVTGLDYATVAAPAFPIVVADDEITTNGAYTTTEIP